MSYIETVVHIDHYQRDSISAEALEDAAFVEGYEVPLTSEDKEFIKAEDNATEQRLKLWIFGAMMANVIAVIPIIFFLGGIYSDGRAAVQMLAKQEQELGSRSRWMQRREAFELSVEMWARDKGYEPLRYNRNTDEWEER